MADISQRTKRKIYFTRSTGKILAKTESEPRVESGWNPGKKTGVNKK